MENNNYIAVFDRARVLYRKYGTVRGNLTEFAYFKKTHRDWKEVLLLLEPAIQEQVKWRARKMGFVPEWKNFKTWIYNRCWEEEHSIRTLSGNISQKQATDEQRVTELTKAAADKAAKKRRLNARKFRRTAP